MYCGSIYMQGVNRIKDSLFFLNGYFLRLHGFFFLTNAPCINYSDFPMLSLKLSYFMHAAFQVKQIPVLMGLHVQYSSNIHFNHLYHLIERTESSILTL